MTQFISLLHRTPTTGLMQQDKLFNCITIGNWIIDAQASSSHGCTPKTNNLPAYMYDEWEVAIYNKNDEEIPPTIMHDMKGIYYDTEMSIFFFMPTQKLQLLFDELILYESTDFRMIKDWSEQIADMTYEEEAVERCLVTHTINHKNERVWKNHMMRRMMLTLYEVK